MNDPKTIILVSFKSAKSRVRAPRSEGSQSQLYKRHPRSINLLK